MVIAVSYNSESKKYGRIPTVFVELDMDFCANTYGIAPCTAAIGLLDLAAHGGLTRLRS